MSSLRKGMQYNAKSDTYKYICIFCITEHMCWQNTIDADTKGYDTI